MKIITYSVSEWSEDLQTYVSVYEESYDYQGPVELAKGPSSQQKQLAAAQANFYNTLTADYGQTFGESQGILNSLTAALKPIITAGPSQYGFSPDEENALKAEAIQDTGRQFANAKQSLNEAQAAEGGGNEFLPSGVKTQQQEKLAASAADQASNELLGIKQAGYERGNRNYESAVSQLESEQGLINPTSLAGTATGAGSSAYESAKTNQQMANQGSIWNTLGGILGGAASAALGNPAGWASVLKSAGGAGGGSNADYYGTGALEE